MTTQQAASHKSERTDDAQWKLGLFYYNPKDPRLFLEKRSGLGRTLNLASPWSWLVLAIIVGLVVALSD
jgi:uncharacterized membrane protein